MFVFFVAFARRVRIIRRSEDSVFVKTYCFIAGLCLAAFVIEAGGEEAGFNRDIRSILSENCLKCHGPDAGERKAGLRLDQRAGAIARGASGHAAIVPGRPESGELMRRVTSDDPDERMPPPETGKRLTADEIEKLRGWIASGARYEEHWAFVSPTKAPLPELSRPDWPRRPVDFFILARLEKEAFSPNPEAPAATLLRRLSLDLTGLPPTPAESSAFESAWRNDAELAWSGAIDRLLASPHFGEKWARWWMDLAHYADTDGYTVDYDRPHAWRWRDWVVDAFNRNLPFDQFTIEQIAGDLLPTSTTEQKIATGFFRHTLSNREGGADLEEHRVKKIVDRTATYGATWLGLTVECAQCHDHKFDPISQRDYHRLYAFFNNADEVNIDAPLPGERERMDAALIGYRKQWTEIVKPVEQPLNVAMRKWEEMMRESERSPGVDYKRDRAVELLGILWGAGKGEGQLEGVRLSKIPAGQRSQRDKERLLDYFVVRGELGLNAEFKELNQAELRKRIGELGRTLPEVSRPQTLEAARFPRQTRIFHRGDFRAPQAAVVAGTPETLPALDSGAKEASRLDLARWTVSPENPLTARVLVNRVWQELFGRGLVATPEDFGARGNPPSHPALLDWLAVDFVESGWDMKRLIRLLVDSAVYGQSSHVDAEAQRRDPANVFLARHARLRIAGELVRDSALHVSGLLNARLGGPSVRPPQPDGVLEEASYGATWKASEGADRYRRGIYTWIQRVVPYAQFATFDLPNANRSCSRRDRSNTPLQALTLLNDPVFVEAADALARRILRESPDASLEERLGRGFRICLGREASDSEIQRLSRFWNERKASFEKARAPEGGVDADAPGLTSPEWSAWRSTAVVLLNLDEFITKE